MKFHIKSHIGFFFGIGFFIFFVKISEASFVVLKMKTSLEVSSSSLTSFSFLSLGDLLEKEALEEEKRRGNFSFLNFVSSYVSSSFSPHSSFSEKKNFSSLKNSLKNRKKKDLFVSFFYLPESWKKLMSLSFYSLPHERGQKILKAKEILLQLEKNLGKGKVLKDSFFKKMENEENKNEEWNLFEHKRQGGDQRRLVFHIPEKIVVKNRGYKISKDLVKKILIKRWSRMCDNCEFVIRSLSLPIIQKKFKGKPWKISYLRSPSSSFSFAFVFDDFHLNSPVSLQVSAQKKASFFWARGKLEIYKRVPVLKQFLVSKRRVQREDFELSFRNVNYSMNRVVLSSSDIIGRKLRLSLKPGDIIWRNSLLKEKALRRGDRVEIKLNHQNWHILLSGQAEQDGFIGDKIKVLNLDSQKSILALVVGKGKVMVVP